MNTSRERIMSRIRAVSGGKPSSPDGHPIASHIRPKFEQPLFDRFKEKLEGAGGNVVRVENPNDVAKTIKDYLDERKLESKLIVSPAFESLGLDDDFTVSYGKSDGNDLVSVTPALCAIAETGSVVLISGKELPTSLNYLPDHHIVIIEEPQLLEHIEDAWTLVRQQGEQPRSVNLISGPSKTADVEQVLQIGAHGPRSLFVIVLPDIE